MKKRWFISVIMLSVLYFFALAFQSQTAGDILSPVLTLFAAIVVYRFYVKQETEKASKLSGFFYALAIFSWFLCDLAWGVASFAFHYHPENILWINYSYSLTNVFLLLAILLEGFYRFKRWNLMQVAMDTVMVAMNIIVLARLFIFQKDINLLRILLLDPISLISIVTSVIIYAWINIWFFSGKKSKEPIYVKIAILGELVFVVTDLIYYYIIIYETYEPNSFLDGGYVLAFLIMALAGVLKSRQKEEEPDWLNKQQESVKRFNRELLFLVVPLAGFLKEGARSPILFFLILVTVFYILLSNLIQTSIYRERLLKQEQVHVSELEQEVEKRTAEIVKIMNTDIVTGLYNRRYLENYLERSIRMIERDEKIYLLYIDQNKYKSIKSIYGKYTAEKILEESGKRIREVVNAENGLLTSYGEDIFVAILKSKDGYKDSVALAQKIIHSCSDMYQIEDQKMAISHNIGIACYPSDSKTVEELIRNADTAMMQARKTGFNHVRVFDQEVGQFIRKKERIELKLKRLKYDEEFYLVYQPQVKCEDGSILGVEALLRWKTKSGEIIPPMDFIPITEENGMIIPLGYWIIEQAAKQYCAWKKSTGRPVKMAVNVSAKQIMEEDFIDKFVAILQQYEIPPIDFEIEITENVQLENTGWMFDVLTKIQEKGISIAVDDFGTGYSSLHYLRELPIQRIKIARELINGVHYDIYAKSIVQMVISIAKVKNIKIIAEGVETTEQWECLKQMDCDEIQGYFFSKPELPDEIEQKWITN